MPGMHSLKVSMGGTPVGSLSVDADGVYHFVYDEVWVKDGGFALSPHLGLDGAYTSGTIKKFLENLIPEGEGLDDLVAFAHISRSNTFAILHTIGHETAGALMFGEMPEQQQAIFREISPAELMERIADMESRSIAIWDKKVRLSLAGVQAKLPVILKGESIGLGDGTLSSTHIMKFQTRKHLHIVVNELFCMKLAEHIGLNVAEVDLRRFGEHPVLLVKRFDRVYEKNKVSRLATIDGCQMLNLSPAYKYEQNFGSGRDVAHIREGASFEKLFSMTRVCSVPAKARLSLLRWALFNLIIGNSDAHGKNFSFFINKHGIKPAPFYDLLSVMMYDFDHGLAMAYGDEFDPDSVRAFELRDFADRVGVNHKLVAKELAALCAKILDAIDHEFFDSSTMTQEEQAFIARLEDFIKARALRFEEVAEAMPFVSF